jgi:hypothetical protein
MERSLFMRGVGYHYDAVKIFMPLEQRNQCTPVHRARAA